MKSLGSLLQLIGGGIAGGCLWQGKWGVYLLGMAGVIMVMIGTYVRCDAEEE